MWEDKKTLFGGRMNQNHQTAKELYFELFETYKKRVKTKHLTWEAFRFERVRGEELSIAAQQIHDHTWNVHGYFPFQVYHPHRIINAPMYIDRVVEQWHIEKDVQPVFMPRLHEYNMACQKNKGPFLSMDHVKAALEEAYQMYGTDFYFLQYDIQGYFDNISHDKAKEMISCINPDAFWLYERVVDSYENKEGYAAQNDPKRRHGMPKGNLPSQWTGIIYLNDVDWDFDSDPKCFFSTRYMDDGLSFYRTKQECENRKKWITNYLTVNKMGVRLHPKKTVYAPISRGFTFCGWRYTLDKDGTIHVRIKNEKKKEQEQRLYGIAKAVQNGTLSLAKANEVRDGIFNYLSHGTESNALIHYMRHQYPFPRIKEPRKK